MADANDTPPDRAVAPRAKIWATRRLWPGLLGAAALGLALSLALFVYWKGLDALPGASGKVTFFLIGTGSTSGTYFPVGEALAAVISHPPGAAPCEQGEHCGVPGLIAVVKSAAGSVANARQVNAGHLDSALVQANVLARAFKGTGEFAGEGSQSALRAIAGLYPEAVHLVVARQAGITKIADLKGKRVSIGPKGSGTQTDAKHILRAYGLRSQQLKMIEADVSRSEQMILTGELDAFFLVTGAPARSIAELSARGVIDLLPIDGAPADRLRLEYPFYTPWEIAGETYQGIGAVNTLSIGAVWVTHEQTDPDLIYRITKALFDPSNRKILQSAHPKGYFITRETAAQGVPILLHPGAERYYREAGILP